MEKWQEEHITKKLPDLIELTRFNAIVQAELVANGILSQTTDVDWLDAQEKQHGKSAARGLYYQMLTGRKGAYKVLYKALVDAKQSGAVSVLIRVPREIFSKPLTYLGISMEVDNFHNEEIEVNGKSMKIHEFLPRANYQILQDIFRETISEVEFYDAFLTIEKQKIVLAKNTIPQMPSYYIPRFLSNRIKIDETIFKSACKDVFVFGNSIARYKLSQIARPHFTDTSTSQLIKITCRFIYLDESEDWTELKGKCTKVPIHLIKYESDLNQFILEDSSAPSDILRKLGSRNQRVYMSEEDFLRQHLSEYCRSSSVCICDSPGMGKTFLLANIARNFIENCAGRIVLFIQLTNFVNDYYPDDPKIIPLPETSLINVLSYGNTIQDNSKLLLKLMKVELIQLEVFLDGFDEISAHIVEWMKQIFRSITTNFPNVRLYISSRAHMRQDLESSLGVVAYDILPFNEQNQVDFLVQFWKNKEPNSDQPSLRMYATSCLQALNESLTKNDKEIAGIPLLCQLIADVYGNKKAFRLIKRGSFHDLPLKISGMYKKFIEMKISLASNNREKFDDIKLVHIWHALKLLFPTGHFHEDSQFKNVCDILLSPVILKAGILQKHSDTSIEFIHRTFAEYLVAEYFATKLQHTQMQTTEEILKLLLNCEKKSVLENEFAHPVIVSFVNCALGDAFISDELEIQGARVASSFSDVEFILLLCTCCDHNSLNIFSFLGKALTKCDESWLVECFTHENCYELLSCCIERSTSQMFHACIHLLTEVLKLDVAQMNTLDKHDTLLQIGALYANYAAVEYFMHKVPLKNQSILEKCITFDDDIEKTEDILQLLLDQDPALIHENPDLLMSPPYGLDTRLFKILVESGASLTALNVFHSTSPLLNCAMYSALHKSPRDYHELVQFLLDSKAEYLFLDHKYWSDPLPYIIKNVTLLPETMKLLGGISGVDVNMKDRWEESLLFYAVEADDMDELCRLVRRGVDYNNATGLRNRSLLHVAVESGGVEMVRYLLSLKLDPNSRDEHGWTPLQYAVRYEKLCVVEVLVENGAIVQVQNNGLRTALHISAEYGTSDSIEITRYLVKKGAEVNDRDYNGNTPLHLCKRKEIADCLIELGANIHAINHNLQTVLLTCAENDYTTGSAEVMEYLIRKGARVNDQDKDGNTPLHLCRCNQGLKDFLVAMGANIHAKNKKGKTPEQESPWLWWSLNQFLD